MKNLVMESLRARGVEVITKNVYKNGVEVEGLTINSNCDGVSPIIYFDDIAEMLIDRSFSEVIDELVSIFANTETPKFSLRFLDDKEFFLEHLFVGMQRVCEQNIIKRPCEEMNGDTELYLYVREDNSDDGFFSCKVDWNILNRIECSEEEAWARAIYNTCEESKLIGMSKMLFNEDAENESIYILTNKLCVNGASSLINRELIERFAREKGVDSLIILPSSTDELLLIPTDGDYDEGNLTDVIQHANEEAVEPRKWLGNRPYILNV